MIMIDHYAFVTDAEAVTMCHERIRKELFLDGQSGAVLTAVAKFAQFFPWIIDGPELVVAVLNDGGEGYADTICDPL
jgi:cysteine synthase